MKRILPVLLGAVTGVIGLPLVVVACWVSAVLLFPMPPQLPLAGLFREVWGHFVNSFHGHMFFASGFVLGLWSVILWRGKRSFWPRLASALCSAGVGIYFLQAMTDIWRWYVSLSQSAKGKSNVLLYSIAYTAPPILWASALFFFAVLARRQTKAKPHLP